MDYFAKFLGYIHTYKSSNSEIVWLKLNIPQYDDREVLFCEMFVQFVYRMNDNSESALSTLTTNYYFVNVLSSLFYIMNGKGRSGR